MAHDAHTKARALAMLMMGDAPQYVADQCGVPYTTCKRWQGEAFDLFKDLIGGPLDLRAVGIGQGSAKMDTKKKRRLT